MPADAGDAAALFGRLRSLAVEAATSFGWARWADDSVSIDQFGASGPGPEVLESFGFTPEHVAVRAAALLDALDGYADIYDDDDEEDDAP